MSRIHISERCAEIDDVPSLLALLEEAPVSEHHTVYEQEDLAGQFAWNRLQTYLGLDDRNQLLSAEEKLSLMRGELQVLLSSGAKFDYERAMARACKMLMNLA